jgi:hypothetical protein
MITDCPAPMLRAMTEDKVTSLIHEDGRKTCWFPVKTSAGDIVGALELTEGGKPGPYERNYVNAGP